MIREKLKNPGMADFPDLCVGCATDDYEGYAKFKQEISKISGKTVIEAKLPLCSACKNEARRLGILAFLAGITIFLFGGMGMFLYRDMFPFSLIPERYEIVIYFLIFLDLALIYYGVSLFFYPLQRYMKLQEKKGGNFSYHFRDPDYAEEFKKLNPYFTVFTFENVEITSDYLDDNRYSTYNSRGRTSYHSSSQPSCSFVKILNYYDYVPPSIGQNILKGIFALFAIIMLMGSSLLFGGASIVISQNQTDTLTRYGLFATGVFLILFGVWFTIYLVKKAYSDPEAYLLELDQCNLTRDQIIEKLHYHFIDNGLILKDSNDDLQWKYLKNNVPIVTVTQVDNEILYAGPKKYLQNVFTVIDEIEE